MYSWKSGIPLAEIITQLHSTEEDVDYLSNIDLMLSDWIESVSKGNLSLFKEWLSDLGVSKKILFHITLNDNLTLTEYPDWWDFIEQSVENFASNSQSFSYDIKFLPKDVRNLFIPIEPMLCLSFKLLTEKITEQLSTFYSVSNLIDEGGETFYKIAFESLVVPLSKLIIKAFVLELNIERMSGNLTGSTPEEKYENFLYSFREQNKLYNFFNEYPVIARQIHVYLTQWIEFITILMNRLLADWAEICTYFGLETSENVISRIESRGDRHRNGSTNTIIYFSSGQKLVYKPRSCEQDIAFQLLQKKVNLDLDFTFFKLFKILPKEGYTWFKYIEHSPCRNEEMLNKFYTSLGAHLALFHILNAADMHSHNIIAHNEYPIFVDLECLCQPKRNINGLRSSRFPSLTETVLSTGLLPKFTGRAIPQIDLSGIGNSREQVVPFKVGGWENISSDTMRFIRKEILVAKGKNLPFSPEDNSHPWQFKDAVISGFEQVYQYFLSKKDEWIQTDFFGIFDSKKVRFLTRATQTYHSVLEESFHPDVLRKALDRDKLFYRLWRSVLTDSSYAQLVKAEVQDLWANDIPIFESFTNSRDLWDSRGKNYVDYFSESGMEVVQRKIRNLGEKDLALQIWIINATFGIALNDLNKSQQLAHQISTSRGLVQENKTKLSSLQTLLETSISIGDKLIELSIDNKDGESTWLNVEFTTGEHSNWAIAEASLRLYDGLPGIIFFLAYLANFTNEERYYDSVLRGLRTIKNRLSDEKQGLNVGFFSGYGGIIYLLCHLSSIFKNDEYLAWAEKLSIEAMNQLERDEVYDIMGGSAGLLASLITLYEVGDVESSLQFATKCADYLINNKLTLDNGVVAWRSPTNTYPLGGFSHGVSGIAWALLKLYKLTSVPRYRNTAIEALEYERFLFSEAEHNWKDLRGISELPRDTSKDKFMIAWCHGAAGIGLSRISIRNFINDNKFESEVDYALQTTMEKGLGMAHCLCHGDLGNLDFILEYGKAYDNESLITLVREHALKLVSTVKINEWTSNPLNDIPELGLMTELAGIGYELLRIYDFINIPSVLILQPPIH